METKPDRGCFKTRLALLWMNLSSEPLIAIYSMIPFILRKELGASAYQIALFTTLSPVLSVLSFYWGSWLTHWKDKLMLNLVSAWVLARLPFLFFPFMDSFWHILLASSIYQFFSRASTPALMEILKRNIPEKPRQTVFSLYYIFSVLEGIVLGFALFMYPGFDWKMLFVITALVSLSAAFFQLRIQVTEERRKKISQPLIAPIKESFKLLKTHRDFARFQWGFMLGGLSLMLIAPVRPIFIADIAGITLSEMTLARCLFVGLGLAGTAYFWKQALEKYGIATLTPWILAGFSLFPLVFLLSPLSLVWFYFAHLLYGVAQAGSHLVWHLSGPIFAGAQNSTPFTTTNVLMIGLRGLIGPFLGGLLCELFGPTFVLILGSLVAFSGALFMMNEPKKIALPLR
jgi:MFS family permease